MSNYRFSMAPNISVPRSKFLMPFNHVTAFNHGKLVPIDCFEILPGDEFKCDLSALIRMSTPIAPIFGNIKAHVHAFFVPMRLVWEHTKEFYGENKTSSGYQSNTYQIPARDLTTNYPGASATSVSNYLGKPLATSGANYGQSTDVFRVSVLKERCYYLIWNEYFRAQQLQNPALVYLGDTGDIAYVSDGNAEISTPYYCGFDDSCLNVCKDFDYFTAMTLAPQYGGAVTLPLGTSAPVVAYNVSSSDYFASGDAASIQVGTVTPTSPVLGQRANFIVTDNVQDGLGQLVADLSNATAASINSIRYAFQIQKWLERSNFGSRFFEMLNLHYGVSSPDARLQRPEYLGGCEFYINVDQVLSMSGYAAGSGQEVGQTGAVSVTGIKNKNLFHKAFVEPGYVMVLISTTHERSYSQGFLREDLRTDRFDFYFPEFANLGDQSIYSGELFYQPSTTNKNEIGFQEHWAEYRYRADRASGILNPNASGALAFWTLAERFATRPTLSSAFIMEDRKELTDALVSGSTGPDYIADFHFNYTAVREMPLYTIPGLVDHFGTM